MLPEDARWYRCGQVHPLKVILLSLQVKEEADRVVEKCGGHIKVTALTGEGSEAAQRNMLLTIGQLVVSTPGRIAQVNPHVLQQKSDMLHLQRTFSARGAVTPGSP